MKACLGAKGTWEELPKNSLEFMHEKHQQMYRQLTKEFPADDDVARR